MSRLAFFLAFVWIAASASLVAQESAPKPPLGLPPVPWPSDNPYSAARVELGRYLFFDARLSIDGMVSCANCHRLQWAFAGGLPPARGVTLKPLPRRAPTLINRAYGRSQFYDGRAASLEDQVHFPVADPNEMGSSQQTAADVISKVPGYAPLFALAFGDPQVTFDRIAKAIASFERTILSGNSPYDRFRSGDQEALSPAARRGLQVFEGSGKCSQCHGGFNFTDEKFASLGLGPDRAPFDLGLETVTGKRRDAGKFKVPTLRDVSRVGPYLHDGRFHTLDEVLEFLRTGDAKADLLAFLESLNGEGWQQIKRPVRLP